MLQTLIRGANVPASRAEQNILLNVQTGCESVLLGGLGILVSVELFKNRRKKNSEISGMERGRD